LTTARPGARCAGQFGHDLARGHEARGGQAKEGHLRADVDEEQMLFEIHGLILALHYEARFLKNPGSMAVPMPASTTSCGTTAPARQPTRTQRPQIPKSNPSVKE
jgi:hypothetical protein